MRIAVDIGFGFVKVMNSTGSKMLFPSVITKRSENTLRGIVGSTGDDYSVSYWEGESYRKTNEKKLFVGDAGMTNGGNRRWEDKDKFNVKELKTFITVAVGLVNPENEEIDLVVGLPMSHYLDKKDELVAILKTTDAHVTYESVTGQRNVKFKTIFCFPQGAGAYYSATLNIDGRVKNYELANTSVGVIDIGYRTVDYLVMTKGKKGIVLSDNHTGSLEEDGINKAFQVIEKVMSEKLGRDIGLIEIEKAILWFDSKLDYQGKHHHLSALEEQSYSDLADVIASKIKLKWGVDADMLSRILITGGGGASLFPVLVKKFSQAELQKNSSYANCEGYLGVQANKMKRG